jgi:hypothetical protein
VTPRQLLRIALPPFLLAVLATLASYAATGPTAGFFFAGVVVVTLLAPPLVLTESTLRRQLLVAVGLVAGVAVAWFVALGDPAIRFADWLRSEVLLAGYAIALWGTTALLRRLRFSAFIAQATTIVVFLAWLAWPVWLSPWIAGRARLVGWLTAAHPLLSLDGVFRALGPAWSERYFMYNFLSVLNQDVAYELPRSVLPAALLHGAIGAAGLVLARRRGPAGPAVDEPDGARGGGGENDVGKDLLP